MVDRIKTAGRQAYQGLTFGFGDELIDLPTAAIVAALTGQKYSDVLKEARDISRENIAKDWQQAPITSAVANIAGGVPFGLAAAGKNVAVKGLQGLDKLSEAAKVRALADAVTNAGKAASDWAATGNRLQRAGKGMAIGSGFGATAGAGAGGDTIEERLASTGLGASIGSIVGGLSGAVSRGAPSVQSVAKKAASQAALNPAEDEFLRQLLMRPDLSDMQKQALVLQGLSKKTGIELTLPEMLAQTDVDPLLAQQSKLVKSPETAGAAQALLQRRMGNPVMGQQGQIIGGLQDVSQQLSPGSYDDLAQGLMTQGRGAAQRITAELSSKAKPLYEIAYSKSVPEKQLADLVTGENGPIIKNAIQAAIKDERFAGKLQGKPVNSIEVLDAAKRIIDERVRAGANPAAPFDTKAYTSAVNSLRQSMIDAAPEYGQALSVYSGNTDVLANRQLMGELANIDQLDPERVVRQLYSGTPGTAQRTAQALGPEGSKMAAAAKLQDIIGGLKSGQMPRQMDADTINMLRAYAGPDADTVTDYLKVVDRARMGERYLRGSQTDALKNIGQGMDDAANVALDVATMNKVGLARRGIDAISDAVKGSQKEQYSRDLLNMFTTPRGMEALDEAVKLQQQMMSLPAKGVSLPVTSAGGGALTSGSASQQYMPSPMVPYAAVPAITQGTIQQLPQGYQIRQKSELPQGYTIRGVQ